MRNKEKLSSNLNDSSDDIFVGSSCTTTDILNEDTELDLYPDLLLDATDGNLTIVIHHDYYSTNSDHGRELLRAFLEVLRDEFNKISRVFVIDSGVQLLDPYNKLNSCFSELCELGFTIIVCQESIDSYNIQFPDYKSVRCASMHEISLELLSSHYLFNLG